MASLICYHSKLFVQPHLLGGNADTEEFMTQQEVIEKTRPGKCGTEERKCVAEKRKRKAEKRKTRNKKAPLEKTSKFVGTLTLRSP